MTPGALFLIINNDERFKRCITCSNKYELYVKDTKTIEGCLSYSCHRSLHYEKTEKTNND